MDMRKAAPKRGAVPYSTEAERQLLGGILNDEQTSISQGIKKLTPNQFFLPESRAVWRAFEYLWAAGDTVTAVSTMFALGELGFIDKLESVLKHEPVESYLVGMMSENFTSYGAATMAKVISTYYERRELIKRGSALVMQGYGVRPSWESKYEGMF